ncbi:MAG TPA: threonine synthase [Candidatus Saccharimonadales bacterium]|nr:threonine synthase [Candidatus Saccharimonadales bacterium]
MPNYCSTRGFEAGTGFETVVMDGFAPDGGLYVPSRGELPELSLQEIDSCRGKTYPEIFEAVTSRFIGGEIPPQLQAEFAESAYSRDNFPKTEGGNTVPLIDAGGGVRLLNVSLGPTIAFKDMAMQPLARWMNHFLVERDDNAIILGATSGDTGSAAEAAFKGLPGVEIAILSPEEGMSPFQRSQMAALSGGNVHNLAVEDGFDEAQKMVIDANKILDLNAVNSINFGRVIAQIPYYFSAYLQAVEHTGQKVDFSIPTGNVGNLFACYMAKKMGLPIDKIIVANNENDTMHRLIQTDVYDPRSERTRTSSPSMDINRPNNFERLFYDLSGEDAEATTRFLAAGGRVPLSRFGIRPLAENGFASARSTHADRLATIKSMYEESGGQIIIDPHTADGVFAARKNQNGNPIIVPMTAGPEKFRATIAEAIGEENAPREGLVLDDKEMDEAFTVIRSFDELLDYLKANTTVQPAMAPAHA